MDHCEVIGLVLFPALHSVQAPAESLSIQLCSAPKFPRSSMWQQLPAAEGAVNNAHALVVGQQLIG